MVGSIQNEASSDVVVVQAGVSPGFKELVGGMNMMQSVVKSHLNMSSSSGETNYTPLNNAAPFNTRTPENAQERLDSGDTTSEVAQRPQIQYQLAAQFALAITSEWKVCEGFVLKDIYLQMAAEMGSEDPAAFHVRLQAFATIDEFEFTVTAEIPNLQSDQDVDVIFTLTLRTPAAPDVVTQAFKEITGSIENTLPSSVVDDELKKTLQNDLMGIMLQLRVTRPAGQPSFSFRSLLFRFYAQRNWKPTLSGSDLNLELRNADFMFFLLKDITDPQALLQIFTRLYGTVIIGETEVDAAATFARNSTGQNTIQFELQVFPDVLSAKDFLDQLFTRNNNQDGIPSRGDMVSSSLGLPSGLWLLEDDFSEPNLQLQLAGKWIARELQYLQLNVYARKLIKFNVPFLNDLELRNLRLMVEFKSWGVLLAGTMLLNKFKVEAELIFIKGKYVQLRGVLEPNSCSLATLARMDVFNDSSDHKSMNVNGYANKIKAGGDVPIDFARETRTVGTHVSFEMLVLNKDKEHTAGAGETDTQPTAETAKLLESNQEPNDPIPASDEQRTLVAAPKDDKTDPGTAKPSKSNAETGYQIQNIKFMSHFGLYWQIVENSIAFENMGICFNVRNPRQATIRKMAGLIYGTWRLRDVELYVYILGKADAKRTDFWAGLNLKKSLISSSSSVKVLDILNDPKFTNIPHPKIALPVQLPQDIQAQPQDQQVSDGLAFDGRLLVHFSKVEEEDKSYKMEEVSIHVDVQSQFTVLDYKLASDAALDIRIISPTNEENHNFSCFFKGSLEFESGLYFQIEVKIPMENEKKKDDRTFTGVDATELESTERKIGLNSKVKSNKDKPYLVDEDVTEDNTGNDLIFLARVAKKAESDKSDTSNYEDRLQTIANSQSTTHEVSFKDLVASSYKPESKQKAIGTQEKISKMLPENFPMSKLEHQERVDFTVALVLRREGGDNARKRKVKSLAVSLTSQDRWDIISNKLWVQDVGLSVLIKYEDHKRSMSGYLQGTIVIDNTMALSGELIYGNEELTVNAVAKFNVRKLLRALDEDENSDPPLTEEVDKYTDTLVGMTAKFKNMKLQSFGVEILTVPKVTILKSLELRAIRFSLHRSTANRTTILTIAGKLAIVIEKHDKAIINISANAENDRIYVKWIAQPVSPATVASGLIDKGFDGADDDNNKPVLPKETGFSDWSEEDSSGFQTGGQVVFVKEDSSMKFESANLDVLLQSDANSEWRMIDGFILMRNFVLAIKVKSEDDKNQLGVAIKADLVLTKRPGAEKVDSPRPYRIKLTCTKESMSAILEPREGATVGDIVYCITAGIIHFPPLFDFPAFLLIKLDFNWLTKATSLDGYFERDEHSWKLPLIQVIEIKKPRLSGTIQRSGKSSTRVSVKGEVMILENVSINVEFVLLRGPILIQGYDLRRIYEIVKRLWDIITGVKNIADWGARHVGSAIGGIIGAVALGGEGLLDVGGFVVGGALAGAAWLAAKLSIIKTLKDLGDKKDHADLERGVQDAVGPLEVTNYGGSSRDPLDGKDRPGAIISPQGEEVTVTQIAVGDKVVLLTGSGTCAGMGERLVEFFLELKYEPKHRLAAHNHILPAGEALEFPGTVNLDVNYTAKTAEPPESESSPVSKLFGGANGMKIGHRYRLPWKTPPQELVDTYTVTLTVSADDEKASTKKDWKVAISAEPNIILSPEKSTVDILTKTVEGTHLLGYLFLRDSEGNIRQGADDRGEVEVKVRGITTKLSLRLNGYIISSTKPLRPGSYNVKVSISGVGKKSKMEVVPVNNLTDLVVFGNGLCNGVQQEADVGINVFDRRGYIREEDLLTAKLKVGQVEHGITLLPVESAGRSTTYTGKYTRPPIGDYEISIFINEIPSADSPFKLKVTEAPVTFDLSKSKINIPQPRVAVGDKQTLTVDLYDVFGSRWRSEDGDPLEGWQIEATPREEEDRTNIPGMRIGVLQPPSDAAHGSSVIKDVSFKFQRIYKLSLYKPGAGGEDAKRLQFANEQTYVTVDEPRRLHSLQLSGDGLQTGYESTTAIVNIRALDQYGEEMDLIPENVKYSLVGMDDKRALVNVREGYKDGSFVYVRPKAIGTGRPKEYFLRLWYNYQGQKTEASGSPFLLRSVSFAEDLDSTSKSFWMKKRFASDKSSRAALVIRDQYSNILHTPASLVVMESSEYKIENVSYKSDDLYHMSFVAKTTTATFKYYLDGTMFEAPLLPESTPLGWIQRDPSLDSIIYVLKKDVAQEITVLTATGAIEDIAELRATIHPLSYTSNEYVIAGFEPSKESANSFIVKAILKTYGEYILRCTYRGLPLSTTPDDHDITIRVEYDRYLSKEEDINLMNNQEREFVTLRANQAKYVGKYSLSAPVGNLRAGKSFNILVNRLDAVPVGWPKEIVFTMVTLNDSDDDEMRLGRIAVFYGDSRKSPLVYGTLPDRDSKTTTINLDAGERIIHTRIMTPPDKSYVCGLVIKTSQKKKHIIPDGFELDETLTYTTTIPFESGGLKGFWGRYGKTIDRLGVVWGS